MITDLNKTLKEILSMSKCSSNKDSNRYTIIRWHARKIRFKDREKKCSICGYSNHVEVCHIKPIKDFPLTSTLGEINEKSNIVILCPNHHWEQEHNQLDL